MVKLIRPLFSSRASGVLADVLEFSSHPRGARVGTRRKPSQPRTLAQMATRRYMTFLSNAWSSLTPAEKLSWKDHRVADFTSPYHAYLSENANRFKNVAGDWWNPNLRDVFPSASWPITKTTTPGGLTAYAFSRTRTDVWFDYACSPLSDNWLTLFFYIPITPATASYGRFVAAYVTNDTLLHRYALPDATADTYRLWVLRVSRTGLAQITRYNYWTFP